MPQEKILDILMRRDGNSHDEAQERIDEAKRDLQGLINSGDMELAFNICEDHFGLEPDYLDELMVDFL